MAKALRMPEERCTSNVFYENSGGNPRNRRMDDVRGGFKKNGRQDIKNKSD